MYKRFLGGISFEPVELLENEIEESISLEYYKTKDLQNYGIEVIKKVQKQNEIIIEKETVKNISNNEVITDKIISTLKKNKVTPIVLREVITELLKKNKTATM